LSDLDFLLFLTLFIIPRTNALFRRTENR